MSTEMKIFRGRVWAWASTTDTESRPATRSRVSIVRAFYIDGLTFRRDGSAAFRAAKRSVARFRLRRAALRSALQARLARSQAHGRRSVESNAFFRATPQR